ncbi:MAG: hypothetical protein ACT4PY_08440, partial [Armatimonadota bacterium]
RDAIARYHDLLSADVAAESQAQLDDQLRRRGLFFGERPICTVLRPRFLTRAHYDFVRTRSVVLLAAFERAHGAAMADPGLRAQFGLTDWEEALVQHDPGYPAYGPTSRLDAFGTGSDDLRFTEYNAEVPAAVAYNDVLSEVFLALPVMREFLREYEVRPLPARHNVLHVLVDAFQRWRGRREAPRIAILDWREVPTYSEFVLFDEYFKSQGLASVITDPREVEYRNGRLSAGDFTITLIYKRVLLSELIDRGGIDHPVVRAVRDGAVCMVNPFRCKILHKKASLAVLSDEANAYMFTAEERAVIDAHIPWTRRIAERKTMHGGQPVDLIPLVLEQRERFVVKSNDEYGGKGIVLGWLTSASDWERAVRAGLDEPAIVQERITVPSEPYPSLVDGRVEVIGRMLDTNPYAFYGTYVDGCMTRLSTEALLNVSAGGGSTVATFVVDKR